MVNCKSELLDEIYERAVEGSDHMEQVECAVDDQIRNLMDRYYHQFLEPESEEARNDLYKVISVAEKEAFVAGVRYGMKIAAESFLAEGGTGYF